MLGTGGPLSLTHMPNKFTAGITDGPSAVTNHAQGFGGHYDLILTSESIYNLDSQHRLLECIKQVGVISHHALA